MPFAGRGTNRVAVDECLPERPGWMADMRRTTYVPAGRTGYVPWLAMAKPGSIRGAERGAEVMRHCSAANKLTYPDQISPESPRRMGE